MTSPDSPTTPPAQGVAGYQELAERLQSTTEALDASLGFVEHGQPPNWDWLRKERAESRALLSRARPPAPEESQADIDFADASIALSNLAHDRIRAIRDHTPAGAEGERISNDLVLIRQLRGLNVCDPDCHGRCLGCPQEVANRAADRLEALATLPSAEQAREEEPYLIWSNEHRAWWRPNSRGYTVSLGAAGRYSRDDAILHSRDRDQNPNEPPPELPVRESDALATLEPVAAIRQRKGSSQ